MNFNNILAALPHFDPNNDFVANLKKQQIARQVREEMAKGQTEYTSGYKTSDPTAEQLNRFNAYNEGLARQDAETFGQPSSAERLRYDQYNQGILDQDVATFGVDPRGLANYEYGQIIPRGVTATPEQLAAGPKLTTPSAADYAYGDPRVAEAIRKYEFRGLSRDTPFTSDEMRYGNMDAVAGILAQHDPLQGLRFANEVKQARRGDTQFARDEAEYARKQKIQADTDAVNAKWAPILKAGAAGMQDYLPGFMEQYNANEGIMDDGHSVAFASGVGGVPVVSRMDGAGNVVSQHQVTPEQYQKWVSDAYQMELAAAQGNIPGYLDKKQASDIAMANLGLKRDEVAGRNTYQQGMLGHNAASLAFERDKFDRMAKAGYFNRTPGGAGGAGNKVLQVKVPRVLANGKTVMETRPIERLGPGRWVDAITGEAVDPGTISLQGDVQQYSPADIRGLVDSGVITPEAARKMLGIDAARDYGAIFGPGSPGESSLNPAGFRPAGRAGNTTEAIQESSYADWVPEKQTGFDRLRAGSLMYRNRRTGEVISENEFNRRTAY